MGRRPESVKSLFGQKVNNAFCDATKKKNSSLCSYDDHATRIFMRQVISGRVMTLFSDLPRVKKDAKGEKNNGKCFGYFGKRSLVASFTLSLARRSSCKKW